MASSNNYCKTSTKDDYPQTICEGCLTRLFIIHVTMLSYSVGYRIMFQKGKVAEA